MNEDLQSAYEYNTNIGIALLAGFTHHRGSIWNVKYGGRAYKEAVRNFNFQSQLTIQLDVLRRILRGNKLEITSEWIDNSLIRITYNLSGIEHELVLYTSDFMGSTKRNYAFLSSLSHIYLNYLAHG